MPSVSFKWNDTNVDVMLQDLEFDQTVLEKNITGFFKGIGVEGLSSGNILRIIQTGFDTIPKIIKMNINDFLKVDGFKEKTATKLFNGIREKIHNASLITIMSASNIFGRGFNEKKLELIMESYPNILLSKDNNFIKIEQIMTIKGMAYKTSEAFVKEIDKFIHFIEEIEIIKKLEVNETKVLDNSHLLFNKTIVMSGFRDTIIQDKLKNVGAKLGSNVTNKTFIVLVKNKNDNTSKIEDAKKLGITLMTPDEFKIKYL